jgi:glycosyltransferase involved in cell wall biosynthesis
MLPNEDVQPPGDGRPLRITIVTGPWFPTPPGPAGGVERVWGDLARHFARLGHHVVVLSRAWDGLPGRDDRDGVQTRRLTRFRQGRNVRIDILKDFAFSIRMLLACPRADVVVTNAFWLPALLAICRPHAGRIAMNVQRVPKGQMWLYRRVDRLSAVSTAIAEAIVAQEPRLGPRVRVIPNPIDLDFFQPPPQRPLDTAGPRTILFTGRIHPEKGIHVLVAAHAILRRDFPGLRLRLVGPTAVHQGGGGEDYVRTLRAAAGDANVELLPPIYDRAALAAELQAATWYCYPTLAERGEAQPIAPMEAMATGLVPVVSDIPQFRDYITPGTTGEVFDHWAGDLAANLAAALRRLIEDPARTGRMSAEALRTARRFGYERVARDYISDFRCLIDQTT